MDKKYRLPKQILSIVLSIVLVASCLPRTSLIAHAADNETVVSVLGGNGEKIADQPTVNDWKKFFGQSITNTEGAGTVWTDKSVFTSVQDYVNATDEQETSDFGLVMDDEENNFLVSLSAIASSKSVEGYSTLPTDTILVLDLSASMINNQAVTPMIQSANDAITRLQELNAYNRVGVVAYSGNAQNGFSQASTAEVILPLGRYTPGLDGNNRSAYLVSSWTTGSGWTRVNHTGVKVANGVTGTVAEGITDAVNQNNAKDADGGTYIQNGLYKAYQQFNAVKDTTIDEGMQAGTSRVPVMVLLSDGAPTTASTNYTNIGTSDSGTGASSYATPGIAFLTQLTASWVREKMETKYGTNALFYTLGLNVQDNDAAESVLDPSNNTATDYYWETYLGLKNKNNKTMDVTIIGDTTKPISYTDSITWTEDSEDYVTEYFSASNATGLINAFSAIVQQIIVQSLYYPTHIETGSSIDHSGFLDFEDYIGKNMEVKSIKGIQLGTKLYTGQTLARMIYEGGMGTEQNPTDAGNNLVWSVQQRLGIDTVAEARTVIGQAYSNGQLYYNPETGEFSNYIGWYADGNEKFVGFWDGMDASADAVPADIKDEAVFAIKSYGYYDAVGEGHRETDMMYATIQVRTTVKDTDVDASDVGDVRVIGRLPASLIPLVEYNIDLNGTDPMNPASMTIEGAEAPSRLIYEVGLDSDVDVLDLAGTAADSFDEGTGKYVFYTNEWHSIEDYSYSYWTNKNTTSFFSPSIENERYYYNVDTPIYIDTNGTLYDGEATPVYNANNLLYHRTIVYERQNNRTVEADYVYEPISEYVLQHTDDLEKRTDANGNTYWVVLKGTIHHYYGGYVVEKNGGNHTGTVHVSDMPFVHDLTAGITPDEFHVDSYLGNNGRLTIDPFEGIKISKTVDNTIADKSGEYTFTVTADVNSFNEECIAIYEDAEGIRTQGTVTFTNGTATVKLSHGETIYILSADMVNRTFTVNEEIDGEYQVGSVTVNGAVVNGDTAEVTVVNNSIATADFVNTRIVNGDVVIGKRVVSTFTSHEDKEFEFTVSLSGDMLSQGDTFKTVKPDGTAGSDIVYSNGVTNTVTLKHSEYITIKGLPEGATVSVEEIDVQGDGFTANKWTDEAVVVAGETQYIVFTNTYDADDSDPFSTVIEVTKNLRRPEGETWNGTFQFQLERYDGTQYVKVGDVVTMAYPGTKTVTLNLTNQVFEAVGTYSYRVVEIVDTNNVNRGIVYDTTPCYFNVVVSDNGTGKLIVSNVVAVTDSTVSGNAENGWKVNATFNNTYVVAGAAEAVINIVKTIGDNGKGVTIPPSGFVFALYEANEQWEYDTNANAAHISYATGADGKTDISFTLDQFKKYHYVLKEVAGNNDNIDYSKQEYRILITVGAVDGKYSVDIKVYEGDLLESQVSKVATENELVAIAETDGLAFENTYTPDPVTLRPAISGTKTLTGRTQQDGDFTFELYETGSDFNVNASATPKYTAAASVEDTSDKGTFKFGNLEYGQVGTYYYVVKEQIPADATNNKKNGVTYDTSEYYITVTVTADNNAGTLSAAAVITKNGTIVSGITFDNTYVPDSTTATIGGSKVLEGGIRKLQARAFEFELLEGNTVIRTAYNGVSDDGVNADFEFGAITYDKAGEYVYTIREKKPDDVDAQNKKNGVTYDGTVYTVIVTVTDNGDGTLTPGVKYYLTTENDPVEAVFTNSYTVEPTYINLGGTKNLKGDVLSKYSGDKAFYYELYLAKWDSNTQSIVPERFITEVTNDVEGDYLFDHGNIAELNFNSTGGYYFIIKEAVPENTDPLMVYDTSEYYVEVDVIDNLTGNLQANTRITKVDAEGNQTMITDDDGNGRVRDDIDFYNVFKEEPITVDIAGKKDYNIDLPEGKFTFEMYQALKGADGKIHAIGEPVLETQNDAEGNFKFEEYVDPAGNQITNYITFSEAGTYYFVAKEQLPEGVTESNKTLDGITYDINAYTITVEVSEDKDETGRSILLAEVLVDEKENGNIIFENKYDASAEKGVVISGEKTLNGKTLTDNEFTFELYEATLSKEGTVSYTGKPIATATNKGKDITFEEIKYTSLKDAGTHYYVVKEQIPEGADKDNTLGSVTYDDTEYLVKVTVEDKGDGTLTVSDPIYMVIGADKKATDAVDTIKFVNDYKPIPVPEPKQEEPKVEEPKPEEPSAPKTGDHFQMGMWMALATSSVAIYATVLGDKKKKEED